MKFSFVTKSHLISFVFLKFPVRILSQIPVTTIFPFTITFHIFWDDKIKYAGNDSFHILSSLSFKFQMVREE